jgi:hypothetical protein
MDTGSVVIAPVANTMQDTGRIPLGGESPSFGPARR